MSFTLKSHQLKYNKLIHKLYLIISLVFVAFNSFSQSNNETLVHLLKFKSSERIDNSAIPFMEICISNKDSSTNCTYSDFEGISMLIDSSENYNFDSLSIKIESSVQEGNSKKLILLLKDFELNKEINWDDKKIILIGHYIMTNEVYKKHINSIEKLPR